MRKVCKTASPLPVRISVRSRQVLLSVAGRTHRFRFSRGMHHLCTLLAYPGIPFRVSQLDAPQLNHPTQAGMPDTPAQLEEHGLQVQARFQPLAMADLQTIRAVKQRLQQIIAELAETEGWNDYARTDALREEQEKLTAYLCEVYRPGKGIRVFPDADRLARKRVLKAIHRAVAEIAAAEPEIALQIKAALRLEETFCYLPGALDLSLTLS